MHVLFRKRKLPSGRCAIVCRITVDGLRCKNDFATGQTCADSEWDAKGQQFTGEGSMEANAALLAIKAELHELYYAAKATGQPVTAESLKRDYTKKDVPQITLSLWVDEYLGQLREQIGNGIRESTYDNYESKGMVVKAFLAAKNKRGLPLEGVDYLFCQRFAEYLEKEKDYSAPYRHKCVQFLKRLVKQANLQERTEANKIAYLPLPKLKRKPPVYLNAAERKAFRACRVNCERLRKVQDVFWFICHTGISYIDYAEQRVWLQVERHKGREWLVYARYKSDVMAYVPLLPEAKAVLAKYRGQLPVISNQKFNEYVKVVAAYARIEKNLSSKIGRNTFTNLMLDKGFSAGAVAAMDGHSDERTTMRYYGNYNRARIETELEKIAL